MHRRTVLGGLLLAFGCTPTGRRLADTPLPNEDDELPPPPAEPLVFLDPGALEPVAGHGRRPLLILVIPAGEELRWRRGRAFGEFLNHGDDASVAPLALFAVSCAPMSELRETYRELRGDREPWLVVVDRTLETPVARALEDEGLDASIEELGSEREIDPRIARLAALVRAAAEPAMVARLAKLEESALAPSLKEELLITTRDLAVARLSVATSAAGRLYAWAFVPGQHDHGNVWRKAESQRVANTSLAVVARDQLVRGQPPKGSAWARASGCGVYVEGAREHPAIGCGMGSVPERSQRFLKFLVGEASE